MKFGHEKRMMLAWLALIAPLPMPLSKALEWPVLFVYALLLVYFMQRVENGNPPSLPNWVLNLLGLGYLPLLFLDLSASVARSRPVTALLHLIMFLIVVKLYSMKTDSDKWHLLNASFFLFIGGMATSTHFSVTLYLLGFLGVCILVLARFAYLHMLGGRGTTQILATSAAMAGQRARPVKLPYRLPFLAGAALVVVIAIPTFATAPRLREPFFMGPGRGAGMVRATGFSDSMDLSLTSSIRGNQDVVLRLRFGDENQRFGEDMRFKGAVYDRYDNRRWHRQLHLLDHEDRLTPSGGLGNRAFRLFNEEASARVEIFREKLESTSLLLPMETIGVAIDGLQSVAVDLGGGVLLPSMPESTIRYEALLAAETRIRARLTEAGEPFSALDQSGITEAMREMAREVMGEEGKPEERIRSLEQYLMTEFEYTTNFVGREGETPLEDFLFDHKSGHCEYFASAMVLLLRAENIPARLVTGFLGAEYNPLESYFMVRQDNAHAWVEAYTEDRGWRVYDPTPPDGRPAVPELDLMRLLGQLYDYLEFRWDLWVLTYGAEDQRSFFETLKERLREIWEQWAGSSEETAPQARENMGGVESSNEDKIRDPDLLLNKVPLTLAVLLFGGALAGLLVWHRRRPWNGAVAYVRLRRRLESAGLEISDSLAPLEMQELAIARYPSARQPTRRLVDLYLRESFAGVALNADEKAGLKELLRSVHDAVKQEDRERRRSSP